MGINLGIEEELLNTFSYDDLERNLLIHRAVDTLKALRGQVTHLESEVNRLEKEVANGR